LSSPQSSSLGDSHRSLVTRPKTKILVDGGDPRETQGVRELLGFVDGQTTNPSLIAKNPDIIRLVREGHKLTEEQEADEYRKIVRAISPLVGSAGVSIEVFADLRTTAEQMFRQGQDMFSWVPNAYVKYPCTTEGFRAAEMSVAAGIRVNMTLCFSQQQAAAVYAATRGTREPAYVSPFIGRLDEKASIWCRTSRACTRAAMVTYSCWGRASVPLRTSCTASRSAPIL
jgi:transaldolase